MKVVLAMVLACMALPATASPWLRDRGAVFLSFGTNVLLSEGAELPVHHDPSAFVSWGATERMTLSFNIASGDAGREYTAEVFALRALPIPEGMGVGSYGLGLAHRHIEASGNASLVGVSLSWGKDFDGGWLAVDSRLLMDIETTRTEGKLDLTLGRHFSDTWSAMLQLQTGQGHSGDIYAKIAPSAIYRVNDRLRLTGGLTQGLTGDKGTGLYLGSWFEF